MDARKEASAVENVRAKRNETTLALIVRANYIAPGISFVTENESVLQIGVLCWPPGHVIDSHSHNPLERSIDSTQEVLFIRSGLVRLDLYDEDQTYVCSRELATGDVVFLCGGGHGLEILEQSDIIEVKQGPYLGEHEKTRFSPVDNPFFREAKNG